MIVEVTVIPKSPVFSLVVKDGKIKIRLTSAPEKGEANAELVKELGKATGRQIRLLTGLSSRRKRIEVDMSESEWAEFLKSSAHP